METATQALHRLTSYGPYDADRMWDPPVDDPLVVRADTRGRDEGVHGPIMRDERPDAPLGGIVLDTVRVRP